MKMRHFLYFIILLNCFFIHLPAQIFMGDVNGDGKINLIDFVKVVNHIQGTEYLTNKSHILDNQTRNGVS